ncbi:hypothetical protein NEOLEDRAFT_1131824 [Neolentinus lepideus HHB14362 ss-1]|uniref:Cation/H+ exchanger transmembrane domain-containing protein n=1 Tax=Neolentinus lepideus HHB14362 ss-1 TaxID=1314782 RepID=A0A165TK49_9AGAM|nr:hypothetical protein NEOLEDRAFT_1131824 [Neolentinus lepideus HHB14362 ss-1]
MVLGGFVVAFSMVSLLVKERMYINEVVLGTAFGVIMGPHCANAFDPRSWGSISNRITLEVMRIVLATGLFAIGVELPQSYMYKHAKGLMIMVIPTMAFGWLVVAAVIRGLFPVLDYISSLAIAACLTPTDPIISAAIVGGKFAIKHVPANLRRILSAESAANDGLAYPFLSISIYLTIERSRGRSFELWFLVGWLYQVVLGVVLGAAMGVLFCHLMKYTYRRGFIDRESYVAQYLALAFLTIGVASTLGSDDLLAAFAAGSAISWDGHFNTQIENEVFSSVIDLVLNCACFIYIGAWLPFTAFNSPELGITPWRLIVLFLAILVLRRIPCLLLLYKWIPEITSWKEALFSGHFGPMGVGAVFVSTLALTRLPEPGENPETQPELLAATLQTIVSFVVLGSILIHGLSIPFFSFGKKVHSRTISLSRTWTSRNAENAPDWVLWTRRVPSTPRVELQDGLAAQSQVALEIGTHGTGKVRDGSETIQSQDPVGDNGLGAATISQDRAAASPHEPLGEASMGLEESGQYMSRRLFDGAS